MNEKQKKSLQVVLDYLRKDEERHYEESDMPENHIYNDIKVLDNFLNE